MEDAMTTINDQASVWSDVAAAWDANIDDVDEVSAAATAAMLEAVAPRPGDRVLELAAGPGVLGATWSMLVGQSGSVVISDIAPAMVEVARRRNTGLANVKAAAIDASAIGWPDNSFEVVASRMGLMFTPDPATAFAEIRRVLAAGGRFAALTWAGPEHNPWLTCVGMAAMVSGVVAGGPPVGPGGIFSLGDPAALASLTKDAGFDEVRTEEIDVIFRAADIDSHVQRVSSLAGPLAAAFRAASPDQLAATRRTAADLAAPYTTDAGIEVPGRALLVAGRA
jgi:ubiquinone/menaquinone biosynthesis C-methylase UbiE